MFESLLKWSVTPFLQELEARWTDSNKHFNDVHATLVSVLESEKASDYRSVYSQPSIDQVGIRSKRVYEQVTFKCLNRLHQLSEVLGHDTTTTARDQCQQ